MYRLLALALLLLPTLTLAQQKATSNGASAPTSYSPQIVARGKLLNQGMIPTTTIITPVQDGLFRLSVYATLTKADPASSSTWNYTLLWTDDAGEEGYGGALFSLSDEALGAFQWNQVAQIGATIVIEAKAGTAISYNVTQNGPADNSAYSLYYTLERLE